MAVVEFRLIPPPEEEPKGDAEAWDAAFESFWRSYPRRVSRRKAEKAWRALRPKSREQFEETYKLIMRLLRHFKTQEWTDRPLDRLPYPSSWLNAESFSARDVDEVCKP